MIWRLVTTAIPNDSPDLVYDTYLLALQSHLEVWLGIIAANLPTIAPMLRSITGIKWNSYFSKYRSGSGRSKESSQSISLKTFGRGTPRPHNRDEFGLLTEQSEIGDDTDAPPGGIQKRQYFQVRRDERRAGVSSRKNPLSIV